MTAGAATGGVRGMNDIASKEDEVVKTMTRL
jgi:hypothetical protein